MQENQKTLCCQTQCLIERGGESMSLHLFQFQLLQTLNLISSFHIHFNIIFINRLCFNNQLIHQIKQIIINSLHKRQRYNICNIFVFQMATTVMEIQHLLNTERQLLIQDPTQFLLDPTKKIVTRPCLQIIHTFVTLHHI